MGANKAVKGPDLSRLSIPEIGLALFQVEKNGNTKISYKEVQIVQEKQ